MFFSWQYTESANTNVEQITRMTNNVNSLSSVTYEPVFNLLSLNFLFPDESNLFAPRVSELNYMLRG